MPLFQWQDSYSVGVPFIDTDHQVLVSLLNQLHEAQEEGQGQEVIGSVLNVLIEYTVNHFRREERLMELGHYPDLAEHRLLHQKLCDEVLRLQAAFESGQGDAVAELNVFLKNWLMGHILGIDTQYKPYVANVEMGPEDLLTPFGMGELNVDEDQFPEELN
jgi:hemerythrin-like metal-binding protein